MAGTAPSRRDGLEARHVVATLFRGKGASWMESATRRWRNRAGKLSRHLRMFPFFCVHAWRGGNQRTAVGVERMKQNILRAPLLHDAPEIHHSHTVREVRDNA